MMMRKGLQNLKKGWAAALCILLVNILNTQAMASDNPQIYKMTYDVYAAGLHAVSADLSIDLNQKDRYSVVLDAYTRGFLGKLAPWKGSFETKGWSNTKHTPFQPEKHISTASWRGEGEFKEYFYAADGSFKDYFITEDPKPRLNPDIAEDLTQNTTDALSTTMAVMHKIGKDGICEGSDEIFDGKRRYKLTFTDQGQTRLTKTKHNIYEGTAYECVPEVEPLAGAWHKKPRGWMSIQEQGRERGSMPTVWFAKMNEDGPVIPVKIRVKTAYGTLFMHLTSYQNGEAEYQKADAQN